MEDKRTLEDLAVEALQVQDACNLSGVVHGFSRAAKRLRELCPELDTPGFARHAIVQLWADKVADLAGRGELNRLTDAYLTCRRLAGLN